MLESNDSTALREFCEAIHPARAAEFMEGLSSEEAWQVLEHTELEHRVDIFSYFGKDRQQEILETHELIPVAKMVAELPPDDRVDMLQEMDPDRLKLLLDELPVEERRDFQRLS